MVRNLAKTYQKVIMMILFSIFTFSLSFVFSSNCASGFAATGSGSCLLESETLRVLDGKNIHARLPMASTTKTMTAYIALTEGNPDDLVKIPKAAAGVEGSSIYLKEGEVWRLSDLVYGLMLRSGNDAAVAIAYHIAENVEKFAEKMNRQAEEWGLQDTHFVNPHGLHDPNHYTSAYDLAVIGAKAMQNPLFKKIVSTKQIKLDGNLEDEEARYFANKNKILSMYEGGNGIKTGFTKAAGRCLIAAGERNGMQVVAVVLNVPDMFEQCCRMMEYAHENYEMRELYHENTVISSIPVENGKNMETVEIAAPKSFRYPLKKDGSEKTEIEYSTVEKVSAPHKKEDSVGEINIKFENRLIFSENIYTMVDIQKRSFWDRLSDRLGQKD